MERRRYVIAVIVFAALTTALPWLLLQPIWNLLRDVARPSPQLLGISLKIDQLLPLLIFVHITIVVAMAYLVLQLSPARSRLVEPVVVPPASPVPVPTAPSEELIRLQTQLVAADRLATVGKLAAGVAHEVGNPLAGILGYASILRGRLAGADAIEMVERIEAEVQRIDHIVRALLELGRPSRGGAEPFDVRPLVDATVRLMSASADFLRVKLEVVGPERLYAVGEAGPFSQVLVNLLLNAAQAMEGSGSVTVRLELRGVTALVVVEDEGPGIAPEALPHLFELFFTTKLPGKGTGLGLAMSRHLLAQFGGTLTAENRSEGGARFSISLPLAQG